MTGVVSASTRLRPAAERADALHDATKRNKKHVLFKASYKHQSGEFDAHLSTQPAGDSAAARVQS